MPFKPLELDPNTPPRVRSFIKKRIEPLFHDVHVMLRLPTGEFEAGCSIPAAMTLLAMIGGFSRVFHFPVGLTKNREPGGDKRRFIDFMRTKYFPFDQPKGKVSYKRAAEITYAEFRNTLVHALAEELSLHKKTNRVVFARGLQNEVKLLKSKNGLSADQMSDIESGTRLPNMKPTFRLASDGTAKIGVASLYKGMREAVERLSKDEKLMKKSAWVLRKVPL
jgi:hypothetical protein